jgi:hypothetical protein
MRTRSLIVGLAALALAGCTGSVSQAPDVAPSPIPSTAPPVTSAEPTGSPVILGVTVHWDGTKCIYDGPTEIRDGTTARFDYTFDEGTDPPLLVVVGVTPGTTWQMITETARTAPASQLPVWAVGDGFARIDPGTSALYTLGIDIGGQPVGGYHVGCLTAPADQGGTDKIYPAALVKLAGPEAVSVERTCKLRKGGTSLVLDCTDVGSDPRLSGFTTETISIVRGALHLEYVTRGDRGSWEGTADITDGRGVWAVNKAGVGWVSVDSYGEFDGMAFGRGPYADLTFDFRTALSSGGHDHDLSGTLDPVD